MRTKQSRRDSSSGYGCPPAAAAAGRTWRGPSWHQPSRAPIRSPTVSGTAREIADSGLIAIRRPYRRSPEYLRRGVRLHSNSLRRYSHVHVPGTDVASGYGECADHRVLTDGRTGEYGGMVGDPHPISDHRSRGSDVRLGHDRVRMRVDVRIVGDRYPIAQHDTAAVVEKDVPVHHHVVTDLEIVAERELDEVKGFEVLADPLED